MVSILRLLNRTHPKTTQLKYRAIYTLIYLIHLTDINECTEGTDRCDQNCHNNVGSYTCSCNTGYRLNANGYGCDGTYELAGILSTYTPCIYCLRFAQFVTDIDECTEGTDRCSQNCHNTVGSYTCSCNTGYRLNADGVTCDGRYS